MDPDTYHDEERDSFFNMLRYFIEHYLQTEAVFVSTGDKRPLKNSVAELINLKYPNERDRSLSSSCKLRNDIEDILHESGVFWRPYLYPDDFIKDFGEEPFRKAYIKFINMLSEK